MQILYHCEVTGHVVQNPFLFLVKDTPELPVITTIKAFFLLWHYHVPDSVLILTQPVEEQWMYQVIILGFTDCS